MDIIYVCYIIPVLLGIFTGMTGNIVWQGAFRDLGERLAKALPDAD
jgi:hypothetical protein